MAARPAGCRDRRSRPLRRHPLLWSTPHPDSTAPASVLAGGARRKRSRSGHVPTDDDALRGDPEYAPARMAPGRPLPPPNDNLGRQSGRPQIPGRRQHGTGDSHQHLSLTVFACTGEDVLSTLRPCPGLRKVAALANPSAWPKCAGPRRPCTVVRRGRPASPVYDPSPGHGTWFRQCFAVIGVEDEVQQLQCVLAQRGRSQAFPPECPAQHA